MDKNAPKGQRTNPAQIRNHPGSRPATTTPVTKPPKK